MKKYYKYEHVVCNILFFFHTNSVTPERRCVVRESNTSNYHLPSDIIIRQLSSGCWGPKMIAENTHEPTQTQEEKHTDINTDMPA